MLTMKLGTASYNLLGSYCGDFISVKMTEDKKGGPVLPRVELACT